jgi:Restriction endonuclease
VPLELNDLGGHEFEDLVERLLLKMGFATEGRKRSADGGIDIIAVSTQPLISGRYIIQCKRYTNSVSSPIIRDLYGVVNASNANKGILITTSTFTSDASEFARDKPIELIDGIQLLNLLNQYSLLSVDSATATPSLLAISIMNAEMAGLHYKYQSALNEIDSITELRKRRLGPDHDKRTLLLYHNFRREAFDKLAKGMREVSPIVKLYDEFMHSKAPDPTSALQIQHRIRDLAEFFVDSYRNVKITEAPRDLAKPHAMLIEVARDALIQYLDGLGQLEDQLSTAAEKGQGSYPVNFTFKLPYSPSELIEAYEEAQRIANKGVM